MPLSLGTMRRAGFAGGGGFLDLRAEPSSLTRATQESTLRRHHWPGRGLPVLLDLAQGSTGTSAVFPRGREVGRE